MNFKLFKKNPKPTLGYWYQITWKREAIEMGVGYDFMKEIQVMYSYDMNPENTQVVEVIPYDEVKIKELQRDNEVVIDRTYGQDIPTNSTVVPNLAHEVLSTFQIRRRM